MPASSKSGDCRRQISSTKNLSDTKRGGQSVISVKNLHSDQIRSARLRFRPFYPLEEEVAF